MIEQLQDQKMNLKRIFVRSQLPNELAPLRELASNLWWSWQKGGNDLFRSITDRPTWENLPIRYNPIALLDELSLEKTNQLVADTAFMQQMNALYQQFRSYMVEKPNPNTPKIAYFCMEYGLHISVRLYSGGLGVLAGDFLKEASDMNVDLIGMGLLYRYGYFQQGLSLHGDQINKYPPQQFTKLPLLPVKTENGEWVKISVEFPGRVVFAKVWKLMVGRISLYLLDTDLDENNWEDRALTHQLYSGDNEHRLKQEMLLGIGGLRALEAIGIQADVYHCNEGHAAFQGLERLTRYMGNDGLSFQEALQVVRSSSLFTTHTPVPAGHDYFNENLLRQYMWEHVVIKGVEWKDFIALGKIDPTNPQELFSMSHLATRLSQGVNGVSKLHGSVSQKMFSVLYPGYNWEENHIGYVTNSVHYPTWIANEWHQVFQGAHGSLFLKDQSNYDYWRYVNHLPDDKVQAIRNNLKQKLISHVKEVVQRDMTNRGESPRAIFEILNSINEDALIFGFARRFATYKRAHLLFKNKERLAAIVNNEERPVMFLFSGKAHPADQGGQALIRDIIQISKQPEFKGKVIFLENYNMESAKLLVQGVDVWMNTPTRPKEASGTSGMKAAMNGVVNFSVLDGWWAEGYRPDAGWALPLERTYNDQNLQDDLDAETIYNILETGIIPTYYDKDENGISAKWLGYVRTIMAEVAPYFTMKRMMDHYMERFYSKLYQSSARMRANDFAAAKSLTQWKQQIRSHWNKIDVLEINVIDTVNESLKIGQTFSPSIKLNLNGVPSQNVGVEAVFYKRKSEQELELKIATDLELQGIEGSVASYGVELPINMAGVYEYGFRLFPKHQDLAHRQDFELVRWL